MKMIFVDAGPLVAIVNPGDQHAEEARLGWLRLAETKLALVSTEHILDEVATAICRWQSPRRAADWVRLQLDSGLIRWISCGPEDWRTATEWLTQYSDQQINFTDALSFTLMRRLRLTEAFTFDRHFQIAGFEKWMAGHKDEG
jgi:predicted nucleic acid-binding protein